MLQPRQLEDVSARYAKEIVELRDFLQKAGVPLGSAAALQDMATRVHGDEAFHRDLTSHVWIVLDGGDRQIGPADLLGALAIAAAGPRLAAEAGEQDAHVLLRFLMGARRALDAPTVGQSADTQDLYVPSARQAAAISSAAEALVAQGDVQDRPGPGLRNADLERLQDADVRKEGRGRGKLAWVAAVCVLAVACIGLWRYRRPSTDPVNAPMATATASSPESKSPGPSSGASLSTSGAETFSGQAGHLSATNTVPRSWRARPAPPTLRETHKVSLPPSAPGPTASRSDSSAGKLLPSTSPTVEASPAPPAAVPARNNADPASVSTAAAVTLPHPKMIAPGPAVPSSTLSRRLGAQTVPGYALAQDGNETGEPWKHPRLLRRRVPPASGASSQARPNLIAEVDPADIPTLPGSHRTAQTSESSAGVVRPISLGRMAANVIYSPSPAYPTEAFAARVQGEVKVQAEVGRDGNVIAARVVSGPPLLRDAALDAVQHWRYRPYVSSGRPVPMSAMAVMDFQLP